MKAGKHVLVEKPVTVDADAAQRLAMLAAAKRRTLQVGHVERFNPAFCALNELAVDVKFAEAVRASSFPGRCLDVGVVMDLMIHDLDLVLSMTEGAVKSVSASGVAVVSDHEDVAEARIEFECGLIANLKASRISPTPTRQMQLFGSQGFADIDFSGPSLSVIRPSQNILDRSFDLGVETDNPLTYGEELFSQRLRVETLELESRNAILDELHDFVISIQTGVPPTVDGTAGARAVAVAGMFSMRSKVDAGIRTRPLPRSAPKFRSASASKQQAAGFINNIVARLSGERGAHRIVVPWPSDRGRFRFARCHLAGCLPSGYDSGMDKTNVAIVGLGTVGSGVARLLLDHGDRTARHAGRTLWLKRAVVRDMSKPEMSICPRVWRRTTSRT